jgi:glyoxylase-like metal-dependent hydrolase (beta-lactamase superfamily II)
MDLPVADGWFQAEDAGDGVTRLIEAHVDPLIESNAWHVRGRDADLVVDTANGIGALRPRIGSLGDGRPVIAVATHGHFDHVGGLAEFDDRRLHAGDVELAANPMPLRMRREDFVPEVEEMYEYYGLPLPDLLVTALPDADFDLAAWAPPPVVPTRLVDEGDAIDLGDRRFAVLHTPGHTAGSICLFEERTGTLFSGDTIYVDGRLSWDDGAAFVASLERLATLPVQRVHAGHARSFDRAEMLATIGIQVRALQT